MFPQTGNQPGTGTGFNTSTALAQNTGLLGNQPIQSFGGGAMPSVDPSMLNSTAPHSSNGNPAVATMVKALKGSVQ